MEQLSEYLGIKSQDDMIEQVSYLIWGAVVTTTKAFAKVEIKIDSNSNRIFISIGLRWWAKFKRFELLRKYWLAKAERRASKHVMNNWKSLIYYKEVSEWKKK